MGANNYVSTNVAMADGRLTESLKQAWLTQDILGHPGLQTNKTNKQTNKQTNKRPKNQTDKKKKKKQANLQNNPSRAGLGVAQ